MPNLNMNVFRKELSTSLKSLAPLANNNAQRRFDKIKEDFLENDFDNHEVSREIREGPTAKSRHLLKGNLYSLLGFVKNEENPVDVLREHLEDKLDLGEKFEFVEDGNNISFNFQVPELDAKSIINNRKFDLKWRKGRTWIRELEEGASGILLYIYMQFFGSRSRSSTGLQRKSNKKSLTKARLRGIPYLSDLAKEWRKRFK